MTFSDRDEAPHAPNAHPFWNESYYFNFFDDDAGWAGATRIGFSPNRGHADGFLCLYLPDGSAGFVRTWHAMDDVSASTEISAPPFRFEMVAPFARWRVHYEGPVFHFPDPRVMAELGRTNLAALPTKALSLDLHFEARHGAYDFHASGARRPISGRAMLDKLRPTYLAKHTRSGLRAIRSLPAMSGANHYEQACRFEGSVTIDGEAHPIRGTGQRDHSWGVRDMRVPKSWRWFSCQFGDALAFNATRVEVLGLEVLGGYAFIDGRTEGLTNMRLDVSEWSEDGRYARRASLTMTVTSGETFTFDIEALTNLPVVVETLGTCTMVNEARARFTWRERGLTSLGISEFMGQLG